MCKPAIDTSLLPQYQSSWAIMERLLVAIHEAGMPIERSANVPGIKVVDGLELKADVLNYFTNNKNAFRAEFMRELETKMHRDQINVFCDVIARVWYKRGRLCKEELPLRLSRSIHDYLRQIAPNRRARFVACDKPEPSVEPLLTVEEVAAILTVNDQMLHHHVEEWKATRPNAGLPSGSEVIIHRGLGLARRMLSRREYREWNYINSYSIAISSPEKFAQMTEGLLPALIHGELETFSGRVLFFSPFIPDMEIGQLEFGIIPAEKPPPIKYQGKHGGIREYFLDPAPYQSERLCARLSR